MLAKEGDRNLTADQKQTKVITARKVHKLVVFALEISFPIASVLSGSFIPG